MEFDVEKLLKLTDKEQEDFVAKLSHEYKAELGQALRIYHQEVEYIQMEAQSGTDPYDDGWDHDHEPDYHDHTSDGQAAIGFDVYQKHNYQDAPLPESEPEDVKTTSKAILKKSSNVPVEIVDLDSTPKGKSSVVEVSDAPQFPMHILPSKLVEYIEASCNANSYVPDFMATSFLTIIGSLIGSKYKIVPRVGFKDFATLWTVIIGPPGSAKSGSIKAILNGFRYAESEEVAAYMTRKELHAQRVEAFENGIPPVSNQPEQPLEDSGDIGLVDITDNMIMEDPGEFEETFPRWEIGDVTSEKLVDLVSENNLLQYHEEIKGWLNNLVGYNGKDSTPVQLKLWDNETAHIDTLGRGHSSARNPSCPVLGGIQNNVLLKEMADTYKKDSGFVDRLLLVNPDIGFKPLGDPLDPALLSWYNQYAKELYTNTRLRTMDPEELSSSTLLDRIEYSHESDLITYEVSYDAGEFFKDKTNFLLEKSFNSEVVVMEGAYTKLSKYLGRFTLILHVLRKGGPIISLSTIEDAWELVKYFGHMAKRTYTFGERKREYEAKYKAAMTQFKNKNLATLIMYDKGKGFTMKEMAKWESSSLSAIQQRIVRGRRIPRS